MQETRATNRNPLARMVERLRNSLQAKMLLISLSGVLASVLLGALVLVLGMRGLSRDMTNQLDQLLGAAGRQRMANQIENTAARINLWMGHSRADLHILAEICQTMIDHEQEFEPLHRAAAGIPYFADQMRYHPEGGYSQNAPDEPTVVTLQTIYHDENGDILPYPSEVLRDTAILDLIMPAIHHQGAEKLWTYYCGDAEAAFLRMTPWVDFGRDAIQNYPEQMEVPYWTWFPGLLETWNAQITDAGAGRVDEEIVTFDPAIDATSGEMIQIYGHPLWNAERTACAGAVWFDLQMDEITRIVEEMRFVGQGFAFLVFADGNVIAVPEHGERALGLQRREVSDQHLVRNLSESGEAGVAALALPLDDTVTLDEIVLAGEPHLLLMRRLDPIPVYRETVGEIVPQHKTLGFVVPLSDLYGHRRSVQESMRATTRSILATQAIVLGLWMLVVMGLVYYFLRRIARGLVSLTDGAARIAGGALDTRVAWSSRDELGDLADAFNHMAQQVETSHLQLERHNASLQREVRERIEAEAALRESQERLVQVVSNMPVLLDAFDENGTLVMWNAECERVTGFGAQEILNNPEGMDLLYPDQDYRAQMMAELERRGSDFVGWEWRLTAKDGSERIVSWSNISERYPIPGWSDWAVGVDVTDRVRAEDELRQHRARLTETVQARTAQLEERIQESEQLNRAMINLLQDLRASNRRLEATTRRLEEANRELDDFAYVVSHDLKAPLRGINQLATWIVEDHREALDEDAVIKLDLLSARVARMHAMIDGMLQYSRAGRERVPMGEVDLDRVTREVIDLLAPPPHIEVTVENKLPTVQGDPTRLSQVFQNLIGNACHYMDKPAGRVTVTCEDDDTHWRFAVRDNGPGIAPRHHERIFRLFQTLAPGDDASSTGVGLALVKRIVESGGGRVWVESDLGSGATFYWTWPKTTPIA